MSVFKILNIDMTFILYFNCPLGSYFRAARNWHGLELGRDIPSQFTSVSDEIFNERYSDDAAFTKRDSYVSETLFRYVSKMSAF